MKRKRLVIGLVSLTSVLVLIGYLLADRYLIEHIEATNTSVAYVQEKETVEVSEKEPVISDMSYVSDSKTINITKNTIQTSNGNVNYYVADVYLKDTTDLISGFAKDSYGTNIIEVPSLIAQNNNAIFAINGDYYGFREDGIMIRNGVIYRDEGVRTGLVIYKDGRMKVYDETTTNAQQLLDEGAWHTLSFGPALVENGVALTNFENVAIDTNFGNRTIDRKNPRTAIGMIDENHFVFVVVEGRSEESAGVTLDELAQIMADLKVKEAYNLDGGFSSAMYFNGEIITSNGKERGTSDILLITK